MPEQQPNNAPRTGPLQYLHISMPVMSMPELPTPLRLFLLLLAVAVAYRELYTGGSNFHLTIERVLGWLTSNFIRLRLLANDTCYPRDRVVWGPGGGNTDPVLPLVCSVYRFWGEWTEVGFAEICAAWTYLYCENFSPTPYTCFARVGVREMINHLYVTHPLLGAALYFWMKPVAVLLRLR